MADVTFTKFNPHISKAKAMHRPAGYDKAVIRPSPHATAPHMGMPHPMQTRNGRVRFRFWYDAIIDWMLLNPDKTLKQCAKDLGRKEDTIYTITSSDIFKHRLAERRADYNARLAAGICEAASGVALAAMKEIHTRIVDNPAKIPTVVLDRIANTAMERLGYGVAPAAPTVQINNDLRTVAVSAETLREAQASMREVHRANSEIIEVVEPIRVSRRDEPELDPLL